MGTGLTRTYDGAVNSQSIGGGVRAGGHHAVGILREFRTFVLRGNVVELAIAVVIGVAFTAVVTALVRDVITPLIAAIGGKPNFADLTLTLNHSRILYGDFLNSLISFLIVASVVYFLIAMPMNRLIALTQRSQRAAAPTTRECPECLSRVPLAARRCAFCTEPLVSAERTD
jgi:large conductance mechanosensitive channel